MKEFCINLKSVKKAAIAPGPAITLRIPFNKPLAKVEPTPSPSRISFMLSTSDFNCSVPYLANGSNVTLPMLFASCCVEVAVCFNKASRV